MMTDKSIPPDFLAIQDPDETLLWLARPQFFDFMLSGAALLTMGIIWAVLDYSIILALQNQQKTLPIGFMLLHLLPLWLALLNMLRLLLVHGNTFYAFSNKRVLARTGFLGTDFYAIDYDQITDLSVNVSPFEKLLRVGTLTVTCGSTTIKFIGIKQPYTVFKQLKQTTVDIKTDWQYPNAMRPNHNPGYRTKYNRRK